MKTEFHNLVDLELKSILLDLGFKEIILKDLVQPEILYCNKRLFFGATWDSRDLYLQIDFGHLYWLKDVMPRVFVLGDYTNYCENLINYSSQKNLNGVHRALKKVKETLSDYTNIYNNKYKLILESYLKPKNNEYKETLREYIGKEVEANELSKYIT